MTEKTVLLLDASGFVINTIVVDDNTPPSFLGKLVSDKTGIYAPVTETMVVSETKNPPGIGWKKKSDGKFEAPPAPIVKPVVDIVSEVVSDERLHLTPAQTAVLQDVLNEKLGR